MPTCPHCGHVSPSDTPFCAGCGRPLAATATDAGETQPISVGVPSTELGTPPAPPAPPPATRPLPPAASASSETLDAPGPQVDWARLLRGNWLGAARVAGTTLVVAGVLATLMVALAKPTDFGLDNSLTLVATVLNGSFGAALVARFHSGGETIRGSVGAVPLTVTVVALLAGTLVFRRVIRGYHRVVDAVADAARAAFLLAVALTVVALVFRADSREFGRGWGTELAHLFDVRIAWGPSIPGSFFAGFLTLFVTLLGAVLVRRDLWPEGVRHLGEVVAPSLYGLGAFVMMLPLAGLVGLVLMMLTGDTVQDADYTAHDFFASASLLFGLLASGGYWLLDLGVGGTLGAHGSDGTTDTSEYHHLGYFAGQDQGLWVAPLVAVLVIGAATVVVARRTRTRETLQASLLTWVALLLVASPLLVWLTSIHGRVSAADGKASGAEGAHGWVAVLLLPLLALVCSAVVAHTRGALDLSRVRELGRGLQSDPGRPPADQG